MIQIVISNVFAICVFALCPIAAVSVFGTMAEARPHESADACSGGVLNDCIRADTILTKNYIFDKAEADSPGVKDSALPGRSGAPGGLSHSPRHASDAGAVGLGEFLEDNNAPKSYEVNANGETYGTAITSFYVGYHPDLVRAEGADGITGYIRESDMRIPNSPEDYSANIDYYSPPYFIPLYEADGVTVIGSFRISGGTGVFVPE